MHARTRRKTLCHADPCVVLALFLLMAFLVCASSATAQRQFDQLGLRLPPDADSTTSVALADVDGDGSPDLVAGNNPGQTKLYLNDGLGRFLDVTSTHLPVNPSDTTTAVVLGDVDGDLDADLVLGNAGGQNRLYLNDGSGNFTDATATNMPPDADATTAVALGDVDGDTDLDMILANAGSQSQLYVNDGTGTFTAVTATRMPIETGQILDVAVGDVDGDADLDILLATGLSEPSKLYINDGAGSFTDESAARLPENRDSTQALALGDVDGDGDADVVFGQGGTPFWQNRLYLNDGTGVFVDATTARMPVDWHDTRALALGDVDGDGDPDLVVGNEPLPQWTGETRLYLNDGTGRFLNRTAMNMPAVTDRTRSVVLGDVDLDGDQDLVVGNFAEANRLYLNDATGSFIQLGPSRVPQESTFTRSLGVADVDADGDQDVFLGNRGQDRLYLNDGTGVLRDATLTHLPSDSDTSTALAFGDVDGDGDPDLVIGSGSSGVGLTGLQTRLYLNDGSGLFADVTAARMPVDADSTQGLALGDVDRDGDLDLVLATESGPGGGLNRLYVNDGTGSFSDVTATQMPVSFSGLSVALGDVEGDGDLDMVFVSRFQLILHLNDGAGVFVDVSGQRGLTTGEENTDLALGDVDGDGDLDVVVGAEPGPFFGREGRTHLLINDGLGFFTNVTGAQMPDDMDQTNAIALADVDRDGDLDVVLGNGVFNRPQNRLYVNDGAGTFSDLTASRMPVLSHETDSLVLGDLDGDDDPEILFASDTQASPLLVHTNYHRQASAPFLPERGRAYVLDFHARPGYATSSYTAWPVIGLALAPVPLPVSSFGSLYLDPSVLALLPPVSVPQAVGIGTLTLPIPRRRSLIGVVPYVQALVVNDTDPTDAHFTGYVADPIL